MHGVSEVWCCRGVLGLCTLCVDPQTYTAYREEHGTSSPYSNILRKPRFFAWLVSSTATIPRSASTIFVFSLRGAILGTRQFKLDEHCEAVKDPFPRSQLNFKRVWSRKRADAHCSLVRTPVRNRFGVVASERPFLPNLFYRPNSIKENVMF